MNRDVIWHQMAIWINVGRDAMAYHRRPMGMLGHHRTITDITPIYLPIGKFFDGEWQSKWMLTRMQQDLASVPQQCCSTTCQISKQFIRQYRIHWTPNGNLNECWPGRYKIWQASHSSAARQHMPATKNNRFTNRICLTCRWKWYIQRFLVLTNM